MFKSKMGLDWNRGLCPFWCGEEGGRADGMRDELVCVRSKAGLLTDLILFYFFGE